MSHNITRPYAMCVQCSAIALKNAITDEQAEASPVIMEMNDADAHVDEHPDHKFLIIYGANE